MMVAFSPMPLTAPQQVVSIKAIIRSVEREAWHATLVPAVSAMHALWVHLKNAIQTMAPIKAMARAVTLIAARVPAVLAMDAFQLLKPNATMPVVTIKAMIRPAQITASLVPAVSVMDAL